jgi:hypothetical protein
MQHFACKEDCLLRVILNSITRRIKFNCELIADLADLHHNKPRRLHEVVTKLQVVNDIQKEKLKDARHLIFCLENGCEVCFPDGGVKYESDADPDDSDDSDAADDSDISESDKTDNDDQEIEIE